MRKRGRKGVKMGRAPCCNKSEVKRGAWTPEEDKLLVDYITKNGHGTWRSFPKLAGLRRCGKSCRLRWTNYLRPDIKRGAFSFEEEQTIFNLHRLHGNKWAAIASRLPGRTDNEIKNFWNSHLRKRIPKSSSTSTSADRNNGFQRACHLREAENNETGLTDSNNINILHEWGYSDGDVLQKQMDFEKLGSEISKFEPESIESEWCDHGMKEKIRVKEEPDEIINDCESRNSFEADDDSSDITLDLLLDFPNDGEYLQYA